MLKHVSRNLRMTDAIYISLHNMYITAIVHNKRFTGHNRHRS